MASLISVASYAATAIAFLLVGYAIRARRDAKVRSEIARVGAMFMEHLERKTVSASPIHLLCDIMMFIGGVWIGFLPDDVRSRGYDRWVGWVIIAIALYAGVPDAIQLFVAK